MKAKILLTAFLLLFATLFSACSNVTVPQSNLPDITENTTEPPAPIPDDPFREVRESKERWLAYGLLAYESGKQVENLKPFFANEPNMMYLTLYDHMFVFDKDLSVPVAEALFAFIYNQYGATALMDTDRRCEYKTA